MNGIEILHCPRCEGNIIKIDGVRRSHTTNAKRLDRAKVKELHFQCGNPDCKWPFWEHEGVWEETNG